MDNPAHQVNEHYQGCMPWQYAKTAEDQQRLITDTRIGLRQIEDVAKYFLDDTTRLVVHENYGWGDNVVLNSKGLFIEEDIVPSTFFKRLLYRGTSKRDVPLDNDANLEATIAYEKMCPGCPLWVFEHIGKLAINNWRPVTEATE